MSVSNIVVTGKSGAGKQPRIDVLLEEFGLTQLSTGNIFRSYLSTYKSLELDLDLERFFDSAKDCFVDDQVIGDALTKACDEKGIAVEEAILGLKATRFVDGGLFVPDNVTNALFEGAFMKAGGTGLVLDGYPRTKAQGEFLLTLVARAGSTIDFILLVENEDEAIIKRTTGRRICKSCQKVYHIEFKPPAAGDLCKVCGTKVIQRSDDTTEKIRTRLAEFAKKTVPAIEALKAAGIPMVEVPGNLPVFTDEAVRESVMSRVKSVL